MELAISRGPSPDHRPRVSKTNSSFAFSDFSPGFIGAFHLCGRGKHGWKVGPAGRNSGIAGALNHQYKVVPPSYKLVYNPH